MDPIVNNDGKGATGQVVDDNNGQVIDPVEFKTLKSSYDNLNSLLGKQGNELGQLRQQLGDAHNKLSQYEQEKIAANAKAAEGAKVQQFDTAMKEVNAQLNGVTEKIAELDVTDPRFTKELTKLQKQQTELQNKAFQLAESKGREETLAMARESFSQELSKRDQLKEERAVKIAIDRFNKENPDFRQMQESGALDPIIKESDGFHDPVSAYWKLKHDQVSTQLSDAQKRLKLAEGEGRTGTVITSTGQEINVNPKEKLSGQDRLNPQKLDAGMRAVLRQMQGGAG